jgi:hypothetical protein
MSLLAMVALLLLALAAEAFGREREAERLSRAR